MILKEDSPNNTTQGNHLQMTLFQRPMQALVDHNTINILNISGALVNRIAGDRGLVLGIIAVVGGFHFLRWTDYTRVCTPAETSADR